MAILLGRVGDAPVAESSAKWRDGQIVDVFEDDHGFGWYEMPIKYIGEFTVVQINAGSPTAYQAFKASDAGTITNGADTFDVAAGDVVVWVSGPVTADRFRSYGPRTEIPNNFFHIKLTDKTKAEVDYYMQEWQHVPTVTQIQANGDDRRIQVTSQMVAVSGKGAFILSDITKLVAAVGGIYVSHTDTDFKFDITAPDTQAQEIKDEIEIAVHRWRTERRRWYITQAGRDFIALNDYIVAGTASQLSQYLRDGLLD